MKPELKAKLEELASSTCWSDNSDFEVDSYAGGNFDDAYYGGEHAGRVLLAREILEDLNS